VICTLRVPSSELLSGLPRDRHAEDVLSRPSRGRRFCIRESGSRDKPSAQLLRLGQVLHSRVFTKLMIPLPRGLLVIAPRDLLTLRGFTQEESFCDILLVRFVLDLVSLQISLPLTLRLQQRCVHLEGLFALGIGITLQTRPLFQRSACISPLVSTYSVFRRVVMRRRIVFILRRRPTFRAT